MASTPSHQQQHHQTHAHGYHTPSSSNAHAPPAPVQHAHELDTTMEDDDEEDDLHQNQHQQQDDEFAFNAPTYYDLKHPEREQQYVNNADGYFYQREAAQVATAPQSPPPRSTPPPSAPPQTPGFPQTPVFPQTPQRPTMNHDGRTPQTPYGMYRDPQREDHSEDSDTEMADDHDHELNQRNDYGDDDQMSDGGESDGTLDLDVLATTGFGPSSAPPGAGSSSSSASTLPPPPPRSLGHSHSSSSLMQPTKAFLHRMQAEQQARDQHHHEAESHLYNSNGHGHTTHARAPRLHTSHRTHSEPKLSSTSREIQKIQEEKMRVQLETLKVREFHERVRAQRVPANVHQRSTKQLTIPQSPFLEVGHRSTSRKAHLLNQSHSSSDDGSALCEEPHQHIAPEQLLSRDFEYPATKSHHGQSQNQNQNQNQNHHLEVTVPHTPQLRTSERATARRNVFPGEDQSPEQHRPDYSKMKVNGVTRPLTPQFETDRRAAQAASYRKPMEVVDKDAEEMNRKFHARPVPRKIFESKPRTSPQKAPSLTKPMSPKLATSARARSIFPTEEEPEKKVPAVARRTGPVVPETPPLRSIHRHQMYQENLRRRQEAEEEEMRKQREFKAQPIRLTSTPPRFGGSKKPLTEVQPFALRGDRLHERAQERLERKRREEEEKLRAAHQFRAKPMPALDDDMHGSGARFHAAPPRAPARALTKPSSPKFATDRRAAERAQYEAAERERRARDEEQKRQLEYERRRQEEEEIKRMRRDELVFHARPVPVPKAFELKPTSRPLTEPESPYLQTKIRGHAAASSSAATTTTTTAA